MWSASTLAIPVHLKMQRQLPGAALMRPASFEGKAGMANGKAAGNLRGWEVEAARAGLTGSSSSLGGGSEGSAVRLSSRCPGAGCCLGQEGREVPDGPRLRQQLLVGWAGLSHDMQRSCRQCLHHDEL